MTKVVFRCDAATIPEIGTGHIHRTIALADGMVQKGWLHPDDIYFYTREDGAYAIAKDYIELSDYQYFPLTANASANSKGESIILAESDADLVIIDRLATEAHVVKAIKDKNIPVVVFDDLGNGANEADLVINAILQENSNEEKIFCGYKYLILQSTRSSTQKKKKSRLKLFVCFGGYDQRRLTEYLLDTLPIINRSFDVDIIVGEVLDDDYQRLNIQLNKARSLSLDNNYFLYKKPKQFYSLFSNADIAITSGGLMAFDSVNLGVPSVTLPQYFHQLDTLKRLSCLELTLLASEEMELSQIKLIDSIQMLIDDPELRTAMFVKGKSVIDGNGKLRVLKLLKGLIKN